MTVSVSYARTHLSRLLRLVAKGEEITILRRGKPVAKMVAIGNIAKARLRRVEKREAPAKQKRN